MSFIILLDTIQESILDLPSHSGRCPDYEEDCKCFTPQEALNCYLPSECYHEGKLYYCDQAEGYCPILCGEV